MKIRKTVATRAVPFGPDMHQIVCWLGLCPRPHWGSLQRSPRPPSWIKGPTSKGGEGTEGGWEGREEGGEGRRGEGRGGEEGRDPPYFKTWLGQCFLGLSVLDLGPMYATDRRQTSDKSIA